ncbi:hypothetical protein ACVWWI_006836 [Bradyrhizobium sp. USDA 3686]
MISPSMNHRASIRSWRRAARKVMVFQPIWPRATLPVSSTRFIQPIAVLIATPKLLGGPIARPNGQIKGVSSYGIDIGQRLEVEAPQGSGNVVGREAGVISIEN